MNKIIYKLRFKLNYTYFKFFNRLYWKISGMDIGNNTSLKKAIITWPHKVSIGDNCTLEHDIYLKHDGPYSNGKSIIIGHNCFIGANVELNICNQINIGNNVLIASGTKIVDHNHGIKKEHLIKNQPSVDIAHIIIEDDAWIGFNSVVLPGAKIEKGGVLAAQSVLNRKIGAYEIWAGVPARKIGERKSL